MADDFYGYDDDPEPRGQDNLFLWTIFILLLIGLAFACWLGSFYIFGHPELPRAYRLLVKLNKLEPPARFKVTAGSEKFSAPPGEFLNAQDLFTKYTKLTPLELERENAEILRNYLRNYQETKKLVTYISGRFVILDSFELRHSDVFPTGVVALGQAAEYPQVLVEHLYTCAPQTVPTLRQKLQTGLDFKVERTNDLSAVIHVERWPDGHLQLTVVPLLYGSYGIKGGAGGFSLEPPITLNMDPGLPILKSDRVQRALNTFAVFRGAKPAVAAPTAENVPRPPELVRVETSAPGASVPPTGAMPPMPVATPLPRGMPPSAPPMIAEGAPPRPVFSTPPARAMTSTPPPISLAMIATPRVAPVAPVPIATPLPRTAPSGVPLRPFIQATRDPSAGSASSSWRTYSSGQVPPGKPITLEVANALPEMIDTGENLERVSMSDRLYLRGEFRVTASGATRAVLRDANKPDSESPRIIVDYPAGFVPPQERERFARDAARPYWIKSVRHGADGTVTIYATEIIQQ